MESAVYSLFKVDIPNLVKSNIYICKNFHIQPSELRCLPFWEYEYYVQEITNDVEAERERQEQEEKQMNSGKNPYGDFKMPDMSMPSFSMPSMPGF